MFKVFTALRTLTCTYAHMRVHTHTHTHIHTHTHTHTQCPPIRMKESHNCRLPVTKDTRRDSYNTCSSCRIYTPPRRQMGACIFRTATTAAHVPPHSLTHSLTCLVMADLFFGPTCSHSSSSSSSSPPTFPSPSPPSPSPPSTPSAMEVSTQK